MTLVYQRWQAISKPSELDTDPMVMFEFAHQPKNQGSTMSDQSPPPNSAQRFILDQMDKLLGRMEQLGLQIRETVARIVGTTVAEAVSEAIRMAMRLVPQRLRSFDQDAGSDRDNYDSYQVDDSDNVESDFIYRPVPRTRWDWRVLMTGVAQLVTRVVVRLKSWKIGPWLPLGGVAALEYLLDIPSAEPAE